MSITTFVQAPPAVRKGWEQVAESIEQSDIGKDYTLILQPPELSIRQNFMAILKRMGQCKTEMVLRLEDDVLVNRYILENIESWPERHEERFGCGWCFDPGGTTYSVRDRMYQRPPTQNRWVNVPHLAYSQAVLFYVKDMKEVSHYVWQWFSSRGGLKQPKACEQDLAIAWAINQMKRQVCIHAPSLAEHLIDMPSSLGHNHPQNSGTSNGTFSVEWRRSAGYVDRFGRAVTTA